LVRRVRDERLVDSVRIGHHEQRVAVRRRLRHRIGADDSPAAHTILDHDWLAESLLELLTQVTRVDVRGAAGGERYDNFHGFGRIAGLPEYAGRDARCRDRPRDLAQQFLESHVSFLLFGCGDCSRSTWRRHRLPAAYRRPAEAVPVTRDSSFAAFRSAQAAQKTDSRLSRAAR